MYIIGSYSRTYALDVKTGREVWQYNVRLPEGILPCCDVVNRGAAIFGDKVYFGALDARMVALDAKTGDVVWRKKIADYKAGDPLASADGKKGDVIFASPFFLGVKNWMHMAYSQNTGNFYMPSKE